MSEEGNDARPGWKKWPPFGFIFVLSVILYPIFVITTFATSLIGWYFNIIVSQYLDIARYAFLINGYIMAASLASIFVLDYLRNFPKLFSYIGGVFTAVVTTILADAISKYLDLK